MLETTTQTCSFVAEKSDPDSWHGDHPDQWKGESESWSCPHTVPDKLLEEETSEQYCVFHTPPAEIPEEIDVGDMFVHTINEESSTADEETARRKKQFIGATFDCLKIEEGTTLDAGDEHPIWLDHSVFQDGISFRRVNVNQGIIASFTDFSDDSDADFTGTNFSGDGVTVFNNADFSGSGATVFENADFSGDGRVDFSRIDFSGDGSVSFSDANFSSSRNIDFAQTNFSDNSEVKFDRAKFKSDDYVYFTNADFSGTDKVNFKHADFSDSGHLLFEMADFSGTGKVSFREADLGGDAVAVFSCIDFSGNGYVDFSETDFSGAGGADFARSNFSGNGNVSFEEAVFDGHGIVEFFRTNFSGHGDVTFDEAKFSSGETIRFKEAKFSSGELIRFKEAKFGGDTDVDFSDVNFTGDADVDFSNVEFSGNVNVSFEGAEFNGSGDLLFDGVKFINNGDVEFINARFPEFVNLQVDDFGPPSDVSFADADFSNCKIEVNSMAGMHLEGIDFTGVDLSGMDFSDAHLELATFSQSVLYGAVFDGAKVDGASFGNAQVNESTQFTGNGTKSAERESIFYDPRYQEEGQTQLNQLKRAATRYLPRRPTWSHDPRSSSSIGDDDEAEGWEVEYLQKAARTYHTLEKIGRENSLPDLQTTGFVGRQEMHRYRYAEKASTGTSGSLGYWGMWLRASISRLTLLYGESPWRVIAAAMTVIFSASLLYPLGLFREAPGGEIYRAESISEYVTMLPDSLYFSTLTFTTLGFGDFQPYGWGRWLATIETALGATLVALLVFVLGRRAAR